MAGMARALRIQTPDLVRHVLSRGNGRMAIFLDDADYRQFIHLLGEAVDDSAIRCWNFCLMPNHYHATLQPTAPNLSQAIQRVNSAYAQWWNRRHTRVGHVFQGRFKDQIVDRESYLLTLSRYVVLNPVRAGLVKHPEEWRWSSYRATLGLTPVPAFLAASLTLDLFGEADLRVQQARFANHITAGVDDAASFDRIRSNDRILGTSAFKKAVEGS
jgi:REP element-mobilizing transposase RayT